MSLSQTLQNSIHHFVQRVKMTSPLFALTRQGRFQEAHLTKFLCSVKYLIHHTPQHLALAERISHERSLLSLASYFQHKIQEEDNHEAWATEDLTAQQSLYEARHVSPAIRHLVSTNEQLIQKDPRLYMLYIYFAECVTVELGAHWLQLLETHCGIHSHQVSVIAQHVILDQEHTAEGAQEIDVLLASEISEAQALQTLEPFEQSIEAFYQDLAALEEAPQCSTAPN